MTLPIDLVLVRHGQSEGNVAKRLAERGDHSLMTPEFLARHTASYRLTKMGTDQAALAGAWLREEFCSEEHPGGFDRYLVSDHVRAIQTAGLLDLPGAAWHLDFNLTERSWGELDQMTEDERLAQFKRNLAMRHVEPFLWKPINGESFIELGARINLVLDALHRKYSDKRVILVCHGEVMWSFRVAIERMPQHIFKDLHLSKDQQHRIHNCQVIHYSRRDPKTGEIAPYANWMRIVRPTNRPAEDFGWQEIKRPAYSNDDLLELTSAVEAMVA